MKKNTTIAIHWFRRDLRIEDNAALWMALTSGHPVLCLFIFDKNILDRLEDKRDARVYFLHNRLNELKKQLTSYGGSLRVEYGEPLTVWKKMSEEYNIATVYTNRDYEPYAHERDAAVYDYLQHKGIAFKGKKDHVIFEKNEVIKDDGKPYTVFTPYSRKWKQKLTPYYYTSYPTEKYLHHLASLEVPPMPTLESMGFHASEIDFPSAVPEVSIIEHYEKNRDFPSIQGTTRLSLHLRFGTVSIRTLVRLALKTSEKWLNELIWRDFYQMILFQFPHSAIQAFKPAYDKIPWRNNKEEFEKWCQGRTGYPIVDAGMRELNTTGFMHNRVRMITASFLTKHLLIDWRWGERYFAAKLLDFDLASNVGGWQWAASSGCDAAPYFRIFNPDSQTQKFDKERRYIRKWVPEVDTPSYPRPIVDHAFARKRCLDVFKAALGAVDETTES